MNRPAGLVPAMTPWQVYHQERYHWVLEAKFVTLNHAQSFLGAWESDQPRRIFDGTLNVWVDAPMEVAAAQNAPVAPLASSGGVQPEGPLLAALRLLREVGDILMGRTILVSDIQLRLQQAQGKILDELDGRP